MRFRFFLIIMFLAVAAMWLLAHANRSHSMNAAYDLNLTPLGYTDPKAPIAFRSTAPVDFSFVNSGLKVHLKYESGPDFYRTAYKEGWSECLRYYLHPHKASWRHSEAYFPWVTDSLPSEFGRDHLAWARRDGFKACSDRLESLLASDPELHSKLLVPAWHRYIWPIVVTLGIAGCIAGRCVYTKLRNNHRMQRSGGGEVSQVVAQLPPPADA